MLAALLKPSLWIVAMVIALVNWVQVARIVLYRDARAGERDFIMAERALGAGHGRILFLHILPHLAPTAIVWGNARHRHHCAARGDAVLPRHRRAAAATSWGNIIFEKPELFPGRAWLVFFPGAVILLTALAFNLVGDALRDILDPTQRGRG